MNKTALIFFLATFSMVVSAYEVSTHAYMSDTAFQRSVLVNKGQGTVFSILGFDRLDEYRPFLSPFSQQPFGEGDEPSKQGHGYFDMGPQGLLYARDPYTEVEEKKMSFLIRAKRIMEPPVSRVVFHMRGWLARGGIREDDLGTGDYDPDPYGQIIRVFNHFYDPVQNRGLASSLLVWQFCQQFQLPCRRAIDWSTGLTDALSGSWQPDTQSRNHFSWASAREAEYRALTARTDQNQNGIYDAEDARLDSVQRTFMWSTTFRALGDFVHLIQDMAQPQHTRLDAHHPLTMPSRQAYEAYTDLRVIRNFSAPSPFDPLRRMDGGFPSESYVAQPTLGVYPAVSFALPRRFFTTQAQNPDGNLPSNSELLSRAGMADFSNRTFFSEGTLPGSIDNDFPLPPTSASDPGYSWQPTKGQLWVNRKRVASDQLTRSVADKAQPGYVDPASLAYGGKIPLLTRSVFYEDAVIFGENASSYALDLYNYTIMADVLMPRAVAYSTGAINHFFRGRLKIEAPPAGLFAIADHGIGHGTDADGYPVCDATVPDPDGGPDLCTAGKVYGFTSLQFKLRNDTATITESGTGLVVPQKLRGGTLVAVARYHRNPCYRADLSGERRLNVAQNATIEPACPDGMRTAYQEISVSAPVPVDGNGMAIVNGQPVPLDDASTSLMKFDFGAQPIPVNATDLFVQAVYRGGLGSVVNGQNLVEPDAIAVGGVDVYEPTYFTSFNSTDYYLVGLQWLTPAAAKPLTPPGTNVDPEPVAVVQMCIDDRIVMFHGVAQQPELGLLPQHALRFAAILERQPHELKQLSILDGEASIDVDDPTWSGQDRQAEREDAATGYDPEPLPWSGRGIVLGTEYVGRYKFYNEDPARPSLRTLSDLPKGPNGFRPDRADYVMLDYPDPSCMQGGKPAATQLARAENGTGG